MAWDSPLERLADLIGACTEATHQAEHGIRLERLVVRTPLELQVRTSDEGVAEVDVAPPRQAIETSVMPVLHSLQLTVEVNQ